MTERQLILVCTCIAVCLVGAAAATWGTQTEDSIPGGDFVYPPEHYLEGEVIRPGYNIFGMNPQSRINNTNQWNQMMCWWGFPPYGGDDEAYFQRLVDEGLAADVASAQVLVESIDWWWWRTARVVLFYNDAWYSNHLDLNDDGCLDSHPFGPYGPGIRPGDWGVQGSGAVFEAYFWNTGSAGPGDEGPGSVKQTYVAVPLDAELIDGFWYDAAGNEIGLYHFPIYVEDCWASVRLCCWCYDEIVFEYRSPSHWGNIKVQGH